MAILTPVLMAGVGAALDFQFAYNVRQQLQDAVDNAVLTAAQSLTSTDAEFHKIAQSAFESNLGKLGVTAIKATATMSRELQPGKLIVRSEASAAAATTLLKILRINTIPVRVGAVAERSVNSESPCLLALDPKSSGSVYAQGKGKIAVPTCTLHVVSNSIQALRQDGGGFISAYRITVAGGFSPGNYSPKPLTNQPVQKDPLAALPEPVMPSRCDYTNKSFSTAFTLKGGTVYCGNISFGAKGTLEPGIHYFRNAVVRLDSNMSMAANGVLLYFGPGSYIERSTGGGLINVSPMQTGTYQGIAIFGSRSNVTIPDFWFNGGKDYQVKGTIYLPRAKINMTGSVDMTVSTTMGRMIAWQFLYRGDSSLAFDSGGVEPPLLMTNLRLTK